MEVVLKSLPPAALMQHSLYLGRSDVNEIPVLS